MSGHENAHDARESVEWFLKAVRVEAKLAQAIRTILDIADGPEHEYVDCFREDINVEDLRSVLEECEGDVSASALIDDSMVMAYFILNNEDN